MNADSRTYKINPVSYFGNLLAVTAVSIGAFACLFLAETPGLNTPEGWVVRLFVLFTLYGVYMFVAMPRRIDLNANDTLEFHSFLKSQIVPIADLTKVETDSMGYYVLFRSAHFSCKVRNRVDGMYELLAALKARNPSLSIKGL